MTREEILRSMEYALESDKRTIKNPISEYGWLFDKIYEWKKSLELEPCDDKRLYIKVFADLEPDDIAEKIYQICDEDKFPKVVESLKEYFDSEPCEDCISRQAAIDCLNADFTIDGKENMETVVDYINGAFEQIKALPSVTPQQRVGKWMLSGGYWRCSECKEKVLLKLDKAKGNCKEYMPIKTNYCPNCGAKMEVSENE